MDINYSNAVRVEMTIFLKENDDILVISCPIFKRFSPSYSQ